MKKSMNSKCKTVTRRQSVLPARKRREKCNSDQDICSYMSTQNVGRRIADGFALAGISE